MIYQMSPRADPKMHISQSLPVASAAVAFMVFMGIVFLFPTSPHTSVQEMNYSVVVFGGVMTLASLWYFLPVYGGRYWFEGPRRTIEEQAVMKESQGDNKSVSEEGSSTKEKDSASASVSVGVSV